MCSWRRSVAKTFRRFGSPEAGSWLIGLSHRCYPSGKMMTSLRWIRPLTSFWKFRNADVHRFLTRQEVHHRQRCLIHGQYQSRAQGTINPRGLRCAWFISDFFISDDRIHSHGQSTEFQLEAQMDL